MSIRIQSEALTGNSVSELSRAEDVARSTSAGTRPISGGSSQNRDRVELSGLSDGLTDALAAANVEHSDRVRRVAALYAAGTYTVDSRRLSSAIVSQAIGSRPVQSGE